MRPSSSPFGILIAQVLPSALVALIYFNILWVVVPLLDAEAIEMWRSHAWALGIITVLGAGYAAYLIITKKQVHPYYAIILFLIYVPLLFSFYEHVSAMLPWSLPRWMVDDDAQFHAIRFLCIPLVYALSILVSSSLQLGGRGTPLRDTLIALSIPLVCYLFVQVIEPWRFDLDFERHTWIVISVVLVVTFLFFLFRAVLALMERNELRVPELGFTTRVLIALVLPLIGLGLNNGAFNTKEFSGIFGDLGHPWFYVIAILNAAVVLWPSSDRPGTRLLQFVLRSIGMAYVLYFFILFVPLLPLSVVAIIAVGAGFLLLAPVLLTLVQGKLLLEDAKFLSTYRSPASIAIIFIACLMVIPACITVHYKLDKRTLNTALDHVYHPDLASENTPPNISQDRLERVMQHVQMLPRRGGISSRTTPFLTPYFNWIVMDNLTLSNEKMRVLQAVFPGNRSTFDSSDQQWRPRSNDVTLSGFTSHSTYDEEQQVWRTWVDLNMQNNGGSNGEYVTEFHLPDGAFICDEYLMIEGERVKGILAEKKAATWIYQQIVNVRRDPSITRYIDRGKVQLSVFPFTNDQERQAGFELLHKEEFDLTIDEQTLVLGDTGTYPVTDPIRSEDGTVAYVPRAEKERSTLVQREVELHVVLDGSAAGKDHRERFIEQVDEVRRSMNVDPEHTMIALADGQPTHFKWNEEGKARIRSHEGVGGFFSDRAIRQILFKACSTPSEKIPLIIVLPSITAAGGFHHGILLDDLNDLAVCLPEGPQIYLRSESRTLSPLQDPAKKLMPLDVRIPAVRAWQESAERTIHLPSTDEGSIAWLKPGPSFKNEISELHDWNDALQLDGRWRDLQLFPNEGSDRWYQLVRSSFQAQILTPVTAWMCLENEAQRRALMKKQDEVLNADSAMDASSERISNMPEPGFWYLLLAALLFFVLKRQW